MTLMAPKAPTSSNILQSQNASKDVCIISSSLGPKLAWKCPWDVECHQS